MESHLKAEYSTIELATLMKFLKMGISNRNKKKIKNREGESILNIQMKIQEIFSNKI